MKDWRNESGQVLVVTALSMLALLCVMGMALDAGMLFRAKRQVQIAADAAAVAGALDFRYNGSDDSAVAAGKAAAAQNGYADGSGGVTVSINIPPKYGETAGLPGYGGRRTRRRHHRGSRVRKVHTDRPADLFDP